MFTHRLYDRDLTLALSIALSTATVGFTAPVIAQATPPSRPWVDIGIGAGANGIKPQDPHRLKGSPQGFAKLGVTLPRGRWGTALDATLSREIPVTGDCVGLSPPSCFASPFNTVGLSLSAVGTPRIPLDFQSNTGAVGIGAYRTLRTFSSNGSLPAVTSFGVHGEAQVVGWSGRRQAMAVGARGVFLPDLHGRPAWTAHLSINWRPRT